MGDLPAPHPAERPIGRHARKGATVVPAPTTMSEVLGTRLSSAAAQPLDADRTPAEPAAPVSTDVTFRPRRLAHRVSTVLVLAAFGATVWAALLAAEEQTTLRVGLAGTFALLSLALWGLHASSAPTLLSVHQGQLVVERAGSRRVVDLVSPYTPIEVHGRPTQWGWRVRIGGAEEPLEINRSTVDPKAFMQTLERLRPIR